MKDQDQKSSKINRQLVLRVCGGLLITGLVVAVALLYYHQRTQTRQLTAATAKTTSLQKQVVSLQGNLKEANDKLAALNAPTVQPTPVALPALTLKVNGVTKDSRGYGYSGNYTLEQVIVDVSLTNNTSSTLPVSVSDFKLKDPNNVEYTPAAGAEWPPAANKAALHNQSLDPGETLSGSFAFGNIPISFDTFRLYYGTKVSTVTPQDATYGWYTYP